MKIAVVGNMNNNGFALMRYFCELGEDAHLFLYSNDGQGSLSHFAPESDDWNLARWNNRIHELSFSNSLVPIQNSLVSILRKLSYLGTKRNASVLLQDIVDLKSIREKFRTFEAIVCSGIAPAIFLKAGITVDIYYPYSTGVEFLANTDVATGSMLRRLYSAISKRSILKGLRAARHIVNSELSITADVLNRYGLSFTPLAIPMVYYQGVDTAADPEPWVQATIHEMRNHEFVIIAPFRNQWVVPLGMTQDSWFESKHNDWLIRAYSDLICLRPECKTMLCLFEYGPDVEHSRQLLRELGIEKNVIWIPKCKRKEILLLNHHASVCVGEFRDQKNIIWGGTGWEAMACGKPLLQSYNFDEGQFEKLFLTPPPPMLPVTCPEDVLQHLLFACDNKRELDEIGIKARRWFDTYNGSKLAESWLELLKTQRPVPKK